MEDTPKSLDDLYCKALIIKNDFRNLLNTDEYKYFKDFQLIKSVKQNINNIVSSLYIIKTKIIRTNVIIYRDQITDIVRRSKKDKKIPKKIKMYQIYIHSIEKNGKLMAMDKTYYIDASYDINYIFKNIKECVWHIKIKINRLIIPNMKYNICCDPVNMVREILNMILLD